MPAMLRSAALAAVIFWLGGDAKAQAPVDPSAPLPPGHPSVGAEAPSDDDDDSSDGAPSPALPEGHPATGDVESPKDRVSPAPDLKPGTIEVHIHDERDRPIPALSVRLGIMHQDVAEGDSRSERLASTDAKGIAVFDGLPSGTAYSYRATVNRDAGAFASEPLRLGDAGGQRVLVHVYPVTRDLRQALVGMRGVLFVQLREDVFHVEASYQVLNIGTVAWVPDGIRLALPDSAKAFRSSDSMSDTRVDRDASGKVQLLGTYSPGQHDIGYQFQLDNTHDRKRTIRVALPPHVAELRVVAERARGMVLSAEGFPEPEPMQGQDGSRLLVTGRRLSRSDSALDAVEITLDNLPVPSPGRWYAAALAALIAVLGLAGSLRREGRGKALLVAKAAEVRQAEELLLDELVSLEKLRREDRIGPRTYQETRLDLLDALARLELRRGAPARP